MSESYLDLDGLRYYNLQKDVQLAGKVDKENGKGLSSNDYTTSDMTKLSNIESGAQVNVIEGISVNGDAQTVTLKSVNISVPTNNNQLVNGAGYQTADQVSAAIQNKVDKVAGKGLSTNDYSNADMTKLSTIESGAQVNIIEQINVNGTAQTVTSKGVNISVPTNNNQLTNGAGYQTASDVNTAIASAIAGIETISKQIVQELPQSGSNNVIYLVPNGASSGQNVYDEYMWINNAWEKTGSSDIDLSGYVQVGDIVAITNAEIDEIISPSTP